MGGVINKAMDVFNVREQQEPPAITHNDVEYLIEHAVEQVVHRYQNGEEYRKQLEGIVQQWAEPRQVLRRRLVYHRKPDWNPQRCTQEHHEWHRTLAHELQTPRKANDRTVKWVVGDWTLGKTTFCRDMRQDDASRVCILQGPLSRQDVIEVLRNHTERYGNTMKVVLWDLGGQHMDNPKTYELVEDLMAGEMFGSVYSGGGVSLPPCHVVCLSGWEPDDQNIQQCRLDVRYCMDTMPPRASKRRAPPPQDTPDAKRPSPKGDSSSDAEEAH